MAKLRVKNYELQKLLGRGPRSYIFKARNVKTDEIFAVKIVPRKSRSDDKFVAQVINEYEVGRRFDHPSILKYYSLEKARRFFFPHQYNLIMEYVEGTTLDKFGKREIGQLLRILVQVADALGYMHDRGYVHSDFKPGNVIVTAKLLPKIFDLGLACRKGTKRERIQGTVDFIAPEQTGKGYIDGLTDIYCFGATTYYLLTGRNIPSTLSLFKKRKGASLMKEVGSLKDFRSDAPAELDRLVMQCLEPNKDRRPDSMKKVAGRLREILKKVSPNRV